MGYNTSGCFYLIVGFYSGIWRRVKDILAAPPKINVKGLNKTYLIDGKSEGILEDIDF